MPEPAEGLGPDRWAGLLREVCRDESISVVFQPIVDTQRGVVAGFEALTRFPAIEGVSRSPEAWFAAAHTLGLAADLEALAIRTALQARASLPPNCFLTVNVSPAVLAAPAVRAAFDVPGGLRGVFVELTEQTDVASYSTIEPAVEQLRGAGALMAVDDAGAGYAGLQRLLVLRPSLIKLDRELIRDIDVDEAKRALVQMMGGFADRIDAWLLAEGVERAEELHALAQLGVPLVQGYHLARPGAAWPEVAPDVAASLLAHQSPRTASVLRDVVEPFPAVESVDATRLQFLEHPETTGVVLVGGDGTPQAYLDSSQLDLAGYTVPLKFNIDTPLASAALRAIARDAHHRFHPLITTDAAGRYTGVVRLERLVEALATPDPPDGKAS